MNLLQKLAHFFPIAWRYVQQHKIISAVVLIVLAVGGYYGYKSLNKTSNETRYILTSVTKGIITTSVSGTGQVSAENTKDVKARASGEITYLNAVAGQKVATGTLLAKIDETDALKSIQTAEDNLESAQISYQQTYGTNDSNPKNKQDATDNLSRDYESGYNSVANAFIDLPAIMVDLNTILHGTTFNNYQQNIDYYTYVAYTYDQKSPTYKDNASKSYQTAKDAYDKTFCDYKATTRFSDNETIDSMISETYTTTKDIAQAVKDANNLIQFYKDTLSDYNIPANSTADTHLSTLSGNLSSVNSNLSSLLSSQNTIKSDKNTLENSDLEVRSAKLSLKQKQDAVQTAKDALGDYYVYAPFNGIISVADVKKGDDASSGSTIATIITQDKIADITLSESDIANIKLGDKATLTFDAIEDLAITGKVTEIDSVGAASSGVVSYGLEIAFDTNNTKAKPGMSVSATIITNSKSDVLAVPTTAVKSDDNGNYYVQVLGTMYDLTDKTNSIKGVISATAPTTKTVTIGLADDTNTEIISGLAEGDQIILRVSKSTTSATSSSPSTKSSTTNSILNTGGPQGGFRPGM
jgi:HlyD family secretion protein